MSAPALVELDNVSRWYGEVIGVNRISVVLRPGITGLLGPNGAGKSTLMNVVAGMLSPSSGTVRVLGQDSFANPAVAARLGYCMQSDAFYERFTGIEFIESLLLLRGWMRSRARASAAHALTLLGMAENMDRKIQTYSKGMRQRTKVALAVAHNPDILVLDEPLNGLDALGRHEMVELVRRWGAEGRNVLISSHVLHEIEAMTNNILMLQGGYLLAEGDVREVRSALKHHPLRVFLRTTEPRRAAAFLLEQPETLSVRVEDADHALFLETRDYAAFHDALQRFVLDAGGDVSLVTVADENISSIFDYLAGNRGGNRGPG
ncbi:MAG: ABC transporter ATP-binding protein [Candidatus Sumerlaeia bacterium]|nr:ABC transporter ATP-binding protein [Candidatus Sumerlaeia bacterium]